MRWLAAICLMLLTSCSGGWEARYALGQEKDGARYYSGGMFGGPALFVYPSGTVHWRYEGGYGRSNSVTYIDKELWQQIAGIVERSSGLDPIDIETNEQAICDGGQAEAFARVGSQAAYYRSENMNCEDLIKKSDKAGREVFELLEALSERLRQRRP